MSTTMLEKPGPQPNELVQRSPIVFVPFKMKKAEFGPASSLFENSWW
jgi:hypothetical protein